MHIDGISPCYGKAWTIEFLLMKKPGQSVLVISNHGQPNGGQMGTFYAYKVWNIKLSLFSINLQYTISYAVVS